MPQSIVGHTNYLPTHHMPNIRPPPPQLVWIGPLYLDNDENDIQLSDVEEPAFKSVKSVKMLNSKALTQILNDNVHPKLFKQYVVMTPNATLLAYTGHDNVKELRDRMSLLSMMWRDYIKETPDLQVLTIESNSCNVIIKLIQDNILLILVGGLMPKFRPEFVNITKEAKGDKRYPTNDLAEKQAQQARRAEEARKAEEEGKGKDALNVPVARKVQFSEDNRFYSPVPSSSGRATRADSPIATSQASGNGTERYSSTDNGDKPVDKGKKPASSASASSSKAAETNALDHFANMMINDNTDLSSNNRRPSNDGRTASSGDKGTSSNDTTNADSNKAKAHRRPLSPELELDVQLGLLHMQRKKLDGGCEYIRNMFKESGFVMPAESFMGF